MKLLFINQFFAPDYAATAQMLSDLAGRLVAAGHDVRVLCGRRRYDRRPGPPLPHRAIIEGVDVHRVGPAGPALTTTGGQMRMFADFFVRAAAVLPRLTTDRDVIVTLTTPPMAGLLAMPHRRRRTHVSWCMDLHPEAEFALDMVSPGGPIGRILRSFSRRIRTGADACVALSDTMAARITDQGVPTDQIHTLPLWGHDHPSPAEEVDRMRRSLAGPDDFLLLYAGNAGVVHTFDAVIDAARRLKKRPEFKLAVVGGGPGHQILREAKADHDLSNLTFHDYVPREQLSSLLAAADAHLVTLRDDAAGIAVPSKVYGTLSAGRPMLYVGPEASEPAALIERFDCGHHLENGHGEGLASAIEGLIDQPDRRRQMDEAGRRAFEEHFTADAGARRWEDLLRTLAERS
ncbi:MAG: glycosyltransferase family 4 protein [Phycisphaeraceae bacterium]|nr:glycosyltransferase family 4 protein [Phycisphaeraceae bacterium]